MLAGSSLGGSAVKTVVSRAGPFTQQLFILCRPELSFNNTEKGYNFPSYRDPAQPWILMTYESGNSIRQRAHYQVQGASPSPWDCQNLVSLSRGNIQYLTAKSCVE